MLPRAFILLAVAFCGAALADCGTGDAVTISDLEGRWVLESIAGRPVAAKPEIYFEIDGRTLTGFDGCNSFGGSLDAPENLRMTQRACAEEGPRLPLDLDDPQAQLEKATLDGDTLELPLADGSGTATLRRRNKE